MRRPVLAGLALLLAVPVVGCAGGRANPLGPGDVGVTPSLDGFANLKGTWRSTSSGGQIVLVWYELRSESGSYSTTNPSGVFAAGATRATQQPGCAPALLDIPNRPNQKATMCVAQGPNKLLQYTVNTNQADQPALGWALSRGQTYYFRLCAQEYSHGPICVGEQTFTVP